MTKRNLWLLCLVVAFAAFPSVGRADDEEKVIRLGMIGLDTSHVIAVTSYLNNPKNNTGCRTPLHGPGHWL